MRGSGGPVLPATSSHSRHVIVSMKAAPATNGQAKHWCFTWNDNENKLTSEDIVDVLAKYCSYLVFQEERGDEDTKHYQGYAEFLKSYRLTGLQKLTLPHRPHWERRKGTRDQAREYCMKEDTRVDGPWEAGEKPWDSKSQGKRNDLESLALMVKDGASDAEIFDAQPGTATRYLKNLQAVRFIFKPVRDHDLEVTLLYGPPGTGKTRLFWDTFPTGWSVPVGKDLWFTGYQGEKEVLIDDFAGNIGLTQLLQLIDRYPVQLATKGYHVWWCPNIIVFTSNCHPCSWYNYESRQDSYKALKRRFTHVFNFVEGADPEELNVEEFFENMKVGEKYKNPYRGPQNWDQ